MIGEVLRNHSRNKGIAMVIVMMALSILAITTLAVVYIGNISLLQNKNESESDRALFAARSGLNVKIEQLRGGDRTDLDQTLPNGTRFNVDVYTAADPDDPWPGFSVPGGNTFYILAEGYSKDGTGGEFGRVRRIGMLVQQNSSNFNAAILVGNKLQMNSNSYTDVFDSASGTPDHTLADVAVYGTTAIVEMDGTSQLGRDGGVASAELLLPSGFGGTVTASAPTNFVNQRTEPLIVAPPTITARSPNLGAANVDVGSGQEFIATPSYSGSEWVYAGNQWKAQDGGVITLDISSVGDGEVVHFDVESIKLEINGTIRIIDTSPGTDPVVELYAQKEFKVENGSLVNPSLVPDRFKLFCDEDEIKIEANSATYAVAQSNVKATLAGNSELFGSLAAPEVIILDSIVHYDQQLATGGGSGGSSLTFLSFHGHSKSPSRPFP